jgi:hypothetical protein
MTSISATSNSNYLSPLQQLENELQSEVNSGAVSSSDQGALSSALTDIKTSLQSGNAATPPSAANSPPGDLKSKIDTLIAGEVSSGKLTSDQATQLQGVFAAVFANGPSGSAPAGAPDPADAASGLVPAPGPGGAGGVHHGHHGHHGGASSADSSSSGGTSSSSDTNDVLQQFLQSLQDSLSASSPTSYGATGNTAPASDGSASFSALLIDYQT